MDCKPWKKLAKNELKVDIVVGLLIALGVCLFSSLGARLDYYLYIIFPIGLIVSAAIGLLCGHSHGLIAGLIAGAGTFLSSGLGVLLGLGLRHLLGATLSLIILAILLLVCKWLYIRELYSKY